MVPHNIVRGDILYASCQIFDFVLPCISSILINEMS